MKLGGGWGQVLHEQVSPVVLLEVQKRAQERLEKKWLPLFYAHEESEPRKKPKVIVIHPLQHCCSSWCHTACFRDGLHTDNSPFSYCWCKQRDVQSL